MMLQCKVCHCRHCLPHPQASSCACVHALQPFIQAIAVRLATMGKAAVHLKRILRTTSCVFFLWAQ